jgi:hypothetical protein
MPKTTKEIIEEDNFIRLAKKLPPANDNDNELINKERKEFWNKKWYSDEELEEIKGELKNKVENHGWESSVIGKVQMNEYIKEVFERHKK